MILECRVPLPSTPDAFDIFTMATAQGRTHVADNVADKNISNIPVNVADMLEMLLISLECC